MSKTNILITGAYGFIGTSLSSHLKENTDNNLIALDLIKPNKGIYNSEYSWDDLDAINWNGLDVVIHLAGKAHDTKNSADPLLYHNINFGLTKIVFDRFLHSEAKTFIFFSSVKAISDSVPGEYLTEIVGPNPKTPYGKSKLEAEQYILEQSLLPGKKIFILRPCMIHGPGNKGNLNLLYKLAQKGLPWPLGAFENSRSFTSIQNLQYVIQELIEKDIEPGIYQIADDETLSTNELIHLIADSLKKKAHIWNISPNIIKFIAKTGDRLGLPLNSERLKKLSESYVVSNEKLKNALGIEKMPYTAIEGMRKTFNSFL